MGDRNRELKDRIENFVISCLGLGNSISPTTVNKPLVSQLIRANSSIGANYYEACQAESSGDLVHKMKIASKECSETSYWLRLLFRTNLNKEGQIEKLLGEAIELGKIFSAITSKFKKS